MSSVFFSLSTSQTQRWILDLSYEGGREFDSVKRMLGSFEKEERWGGGGGKKGWGLTSTYHLLTSIYRAWKGFWSAGNIARPPPHGADTGGGGGEGDFNYGALEASPPHLKTCNLPDPQAASNLGLRTKRRGRQVDVPLWKEAQCSSWSLLLFGSKLVSVLNKTAGVNSVGKHTRPIHCRLATGQVSVGKFE